MDFMSMEIKVDTAIGGLKGFVSYSEIERISAIIKSLKEDENRLKCIINDIENFHRDMFVLQEKTASTSMNLEMNDCISSLYSLTEPERPENRPSTSMYNTDSCLRGLPLNPPELLGNGLDDESSDVAISYVKNTNYENQDQPHDESVDVNDESDSGKSESSSSSSGSSSSSSGSSSSSSGSSSSNGSGRNNRKKSNDHKDGPTEEEKEWAKKAVLTLLDDKEEEITNLLLHLYSKFSSFQDSLQKAKVEYEVKEVFPREPDVPSKTFLRSLKESVLYLDKTITKIYAKYFEMLTNLENKKIR